MGHRGENETSFDDGERSNHFCGYQNLHQQQVTTNPASKIAERETKAVMLGANPGRTLLINFEMKYIDADRLRARIEKYLTFDNSIDTAFYIGRRDAERSILALIDSLQEEKIDMSEVSDGYHTFNELYYYRMLYNAAFFNLLPKEWVHKSKRHHTGEECFGWGWFIVMANLPTGQISNHYELKDWDLFKVPVKEFADEWDGHTPQEAADRLHKYLQQEQPEADLEEAAEKYGSDYPAYNDDQFIAENAFKAGAGWMAKQGVSYQATISADKTIPVLPMKDVSDMGLDYGDKVRIIILPEEG